VTIDIRKYCVGEELLLRELFFQTIHAVNSKDYTTQQVDAWAPKDYDREGWIERIQRINPYVAIVDGEIAGYADIQADGYIDHFYCHWRYQGKGVGSRLMATLLNDGQHLGLERFYSHVSITAKPFFEHYGFTVVKQQRVCLQGVYLTNFIMEKCQ
jgi:putative acetyltransferase